MRKTVDVEYVRHHVNQLLRTVPASKVTDDFRMGAASVLEMILHETGNYRGFGYHDVDTTTDPPTIPNESRRIYY